MTEEMRPQTSFAEAARGTSGLAETFCVLLKLKEPLRDHLRFFAVRHEAGNYMLNRSQVKDDFV